MCYRAATVRERTRKEAVPTKHPMNLTGRVAVVIGGTSGLGRKLAAGLAAAGADVVPTGRREPLIEEACLEINAPAAAR